MLNKALFFSITLLVASGCAKAPEPIWDTAPYTLAFGGLPEPELPADNPLTEQCVKL